VGLALVASCVIESWMETLCGSVNAALVSVSLRFLGRETASWILS
jgi:hypothetical protein